MHPACEVNKPIAVDLCSGLGGWAEGLEAEGWDVIRVDIEDMFAATGTPKPPNCLLMLQDILTFHGSQAKHADLIVASPPCQKYSYMAMPWKLAKARAAAIRADESGQMLADLNALFNACFRIRREACEAAGHHIPMVVENVRGAIPWVGRSAWNFGSFHLWGDVPALMPQPVRSRKNGDVGGGSWFAIGSPGQKSVGGNPDGRKVPGFRFDGSGQSFQTASVEGTKGSCGYERTYAGGKPLGWAIPSTSSKSPARKAASAEIAKIPTVLARHIARVYKPVDFDVL